MEIIMIIDLSSILKDYGGVMKVCVKSDFKDTDFLGEKFSFPEGLLVDGRITNNTKSLHLSAKVTGKLVTVCARCLKPVEDDVSFDISEILVRDDDKDKVTDEDVVIFSGYTLDIDDIVIDNFLMNISGKYLCKEDCKGLCPKCGQDLNLGECECSDEEIDPRWAALAEIMKNSDTE
ncbi:MAG: DUF177 domain-containing protein [Clostridia bacterium]|nr:DUF177 domain-containing protein [Clostridia bacterium]